MMVKCQSWFGSGDLRTILTSVLPDDIMMPPTYASGPIFSPQTAMLPQGLSLLAPPPYQTLVCFPYASLSPPMDPWHHRVHAPASCMADLGIHAFSIMDRPMESPLISRDDIDHRQQIALLQAANN